MEFFDPKSLNFQFSKYFKLANILSLSVTLICLVLIFKPGLNYGIDFRGGVEATVSFTDPSVKVADLRAVIEPHMANASIVNFEGSQKNEYSITAQSESSDAVATKLRETLTAKYGPEGQAWKIDRLGSVGPKVSADLRKSALLSLIYACILITLYMFWRFDMRFVPGVLACIFHDIIFTVGILVIFRMEFSTTVLAALLTLAGYSVNDTVVIFDRIREVEGKLLGKTKKQVVDFAANSTLSRTIMTSMTTLFACLMLYFFGGPTLREFSIALFVGIIIGTYSSVFVASPLFLWADGFIERRKLAAVGK